MWATVGKFKKRKKNPNISLFLEEIFQLSRLLWSKHWSQKHKKRKNINKVWTIVYYTDSLKDGFNNSLLCNIGTFGHNLDSFCFVCPDVWDNIVRVVALVRNVSNSGHGDNYTCLFQWLENGLLKQLTLVFLETLLYECSWQKHYFPFIFDLAGPTKSYKHDHYSHIPLVFGTMYPSLCCCATITITICSHLLFHTATTYNRS